MTCQPESVTAWVDGGLTAEERERVAQHVEACAECRAQAESETALRTRLRALPQLAARAGFERELAGRLRSRRIPRLARVLLPLAAGLAVAGFWLRGSPEAVARELAFDHAKCFRKQQLPAKVVGNDAAVISGWFEAQGTSLPGIPAPAAGLQLQGARYCPLLDGTFVAHVYYRDGPRTASLFLIPRALRMGTVLNTTALGRQVRLIADGDRTLAVVAENAADVEALSAALGRRLALLFVP
jgi:hypothetical protein